MSAKAIFITGGASGIGLATAKYFAGRGWRVGLADVNAAALDRARQALGDAAIYVMDVRDRGQWAEALADFTRPGGGRLDVLFNNAGIALGGPFDTQDLDEIDRGIAINLTGVVNGAHIGFPYLKATPGSVMLITSSAAGICGTAGAAIYSATKFAVRGLAESLDNEWLRYGIGVRTLMPSFIDTPLLDQSLQQSNRSVRESVTASGLEITPVEQVAEAAWRAVHGKQVHTRVGKTANRLWFLARWSPGTLRKFTSKRLHEDV